MDEYDKILNQFERYLSKENIENSFEYVNMYYLYTVLNDNFKQYRKAMNNSELVEKINSESIFFRMQKKFGFLKKFNSEKCLYAISKIGENTLELAIKFYSNRKDGIITLRIYKDIGNDEIYFDGLCRSETVKKYTNKYRTEILNTFSILEKYATILKKVEKYQITPIFNFSDNFIKISLLFYENGQVVPNISLVSESDQQIYKRIWLNRETIKETFEGNLEELMKKIPVSINELNQPFQDIVCASLPKGKTLQRKKQ